MLEKLNLTIDRHTFVTLLGPSGCGKTTTLRLIGGFEKPDEGRVFYEDTDITDLPPYKRKLNTVFQKYALFPHMDVYENIAFGLRLKKLSKSVIDDKVKRMLKLVNLSGFEKRNIDSLSGGQQQRVAIARALVNEPEVLLLDEPLGALDLKLRKRCSLSLKISSRRWALPCLCDPRPRGSATMSDTIVVMKDGLVLQQGAPTDIYNEPENAFVADFIGESNIIDGVMHEDRLVSFAAQI